MGKLQSQACAMRVMPYTTPAQIHLFDRQEAILRVLSYKEQGCQSQADIFAPVFIAAYKHHTDVAQRQGRLITRQAPHV